MSDFEPTQSSARAKTRDTDSKITSKGAPPAPGPAKSRPANPQSEGIADRLQELARRRIAIESVSPEIDGGRFPAKAIVGIPFRVEADIFCDGHDKIDAALLTRPIGSQQWTETPMVLLENDRWRGHATFETNQFYEYTVIAWRDLFASWRAEVSKKHAAGLGLSLELEEGRRILQAAGKGPRAKQAADPEFEAILAALGDSTNDGDRFSILMSESLAARLRRVGERTNLSQYELTLQVFVDRERAGFSAWYELMPRSQSGTPERHGTFDDVVRRLPYVRDLGFDVLYFPPIHPVGKTNRKGRNNSLVATTNDPGSPYAIGSSEGGHDAIHPELGNFDNFARLIAAAREHGLEIALDFAIQCSPDHPWIKEHPEWFDWRPTTTWFAENPPKKYEDIVNVHLSRCHPLPMVCAARYRDFLVFWRQDISRRQSSHQAVSVLGMDDRRGSREASRCHLPAEAFTRPKVMATGKGRLRPVL